MANPSLQIGNSNWAIKEDNLLGYSTAGTRFVPQPITMTRESAGTRVNSSGLVETVELLGSELVTNGDFATDSGWNKQPGWTISDGTANYDGSGNNYMSQNIGFSDGKTYKIKFDVTAISQGTINLYVNKPAFTLVKSATQTGSYEVFVTVTGGSQVIYFYSASNFIGSIDNVSIKESTKNNLARVDYDGTASSLLVEPERTNLITYSSDFSDSIWTKLAAGSGIAPIITSDYSISPSGTQTADRIQFNLNGGTGGGDTSYINTSLSAGTINASASIYLKTNDNTTKDITLRLGAGLFDYDVTVTSEWQRFSLLGNTNVDRIQLLLYGNKNSQTADLSVWGVQVEEGSYATSYIPTDGGTVTRVQDQYSKTGISNLINSEEGVLFVEAKVKIDTDFSANCFGISDGTDANRLSIIMYGNINSIRASMNVGGVNQFDFNLSGYSREQYYKIAVLYKANDCRIFINGTKIATNISSTMPPIGTLDRLNFDLGTGLYKFFGKVKQLQVFKTALTDSELAALTS